MNLFTYTRANDSDAAIAAVAKDQHAKFLAGGTSLVDLMKLNVEQPTTLVDINRLPMSWVVTRDIGGAADGPFVTPGHTGIGANFRNSDLAHHKLIQKMYPALSEALLSGASPQLRNMATTAGNLLQRTRCYYFRDTASPCNKRTPGSGCSAIDGYNRIHAVLGTSEKCIATHPSDMCVALAAFEAIIVTNTDRRIPIDEFYVPYGDDPARENVLNHGEMIVHIELPNTPFFARSKYIKTRDRASYEFALASAAVALDIDAGTIKQARIALGGVASKPWRSLDAEKVLVGQKASDALYAQAADAAMKDAKPQKFNAFKIELAKRTIVRALQAVAAMA